MTCGAILSTFGLALAFGGFLSTLLAFLLVLGIVVLVHELGHFLAAKSVGIRVERFSIGFPPRLLGLKLGDTDYCLSAVPIGGYVKMSGMIDETTLDSEKAEGTVTGAPWEFMSKGFWAKTFAISAGVIMNFLLAIAIFSVQAYREGYQEVIDHSATVGQLEPGAPAAAAGLKPGDRILAIDGHPVKAWEGMTSLIQAAHGELELTLLRGAAQHSVRLTPERRQIPDAETGQVVERSIIGIQPRTRHLQPGLVQSVGLGVEQTWYWTHLVLGTVGRLLTGKASVKELGGPIVIAQISHQSYSRGWADLFHFIAVLSVNLGLLNLFPIPALDGGHLVIIGLEAVMRRPLSSRARLVVQQVGMAMLLVLMALVMYNDVLRQL
jgi:regulator of sigma E protease